MVELLKTAIITKWQKVSQRFIDSSFNEGCRGIECCEEWLWTCRTLQSRLNNGVYEALLSRKIAFAYGIVT